jgi:hypothetical protein
MNRTSCIFLATFLMAATVSAQTQVVNAKAFIEWNPFYSLKWDDFQGKPGEDAAGDAGTSVQIKAKPYTVGNKVEYDVYVLFNREKSWSRDQSAQLLEHEQLHFDLAEVFARKIRKKIQELEDQHISDIKAYNKAIRRLLEESNEADRQYDMETLHGALDKKQEVWRKKVGDDLLSLKAYKKEKHVLSAGS